MWFVAADVIIIDMCVFLNPFPFTLTCVQVMNYEVPVAEAGVVDKHRQGNTERHHPGHHDQEVGDAVAATGVADGSEDGVEPVHADTNHAVDGGCGQ